MCVDYIIPNLNINKSDIAHIITKYISDQDITRYLGPKAMKHIMKYSELSDYPNIEALLPKKRDFVILLIESSFNSGHWISVIRDGKNIEIFNSYGCPPSSDLDLLTDTQRQKLGEERKWLNELLNDAMNRFNIYYNSVDLQKESPNVNTCGRFQLLRINLFLIRKYNLQQFLDFMKANCAHYHLTPDQLVSAIII